MTEKDALLLVIKHKGDCVYSEEVTGYCCTTCPFSTTDSICGSICGTGDYADPMYVRKKYEAILEYYIKKYGKDPDLMEQLI